MAKAKMSKIWLGVGVLTLIILAFFTYTMIIAPNFSGAPQLKTGSITGTQPTVAPTVTTGTGTGAQLPAYLQFSDTIGSNGFSGQTVTVYNSQNVKTDPTLTITSGNTATTSSLWAPGATGYVQIGDNSNFTRASIPFTVSYAPTTGTYGAQVYSAQVTDQKIGTYTIQCQDNLGHSYTSASYVNFTTLGTNSVTLSFTIYNGALNTGYKTTYDQLDNVNQACGVTMSTTGSSLSFPSGIGGLSATQTFARGTSTYWSGLCSDSALTNQKVGQTQTLMGQQAFSLTINKGALTAGAAQNQTISLIAPFDTTYFAANGVGGPNQVTLATFNLGVAA